MPVNNMTPSRNLHLLVTPTTIVILAVEPAGDVNADGYDDLWAGGSSLYLFHGTPR